MKYNQRGNKSNRIELETHASNSGIGAILKKDNEIIGCISETLKGKQLYYTGTQKELYAAQRAMKEFEYDLRGREFDLITCHKAMEYYDTSKKVGDPDYNLWFEELSQYNFSTKYRSKKDMKEVDDLSRCGE